MAGKPIRLGKAAGELNVGLPTIVEFLVTKGIKIDSNPNTRLEPEHFDLLLKEFAADQSMMEKAKGTSNRRERRETVTMSDIAPEEKKVIKDDDEEGDAINLEETKAKIEEIGEGMGAATFFATVNKRCKGCPVRKSCPVQSDGRAVIES